MPGKGKTPKEKKEKKKKTSIDKSGDEAAEGEEDKAKSGKKKKGSKGKKGGGKGKSSKFSGDMFSEAAIENSYYLCHNIQDVLKSRGFIWPELQKKKKKGKKR
ncbi:small lysine-rich protein 1 [Culicoides brevitarsis]|uniref:small lysine-rich protein 1 n=1 Tax=Culicoides brevitarsis TaxID=469753 RepID=UPI00307BE9E9